MSDMIPLKEHLLALRDADMRLLSERDTANKDALAAALAATTKALDVLAEAYKSDKANANEWRATVNDLLAVARGSKTGTRELIAYLVTAITIALAVAQYIAKH